MGHLKHLDDPKPIWDPGPKHILDPKPIFDPPKPLWDPKHIFDPSNVLIKNLRDEIYRRVWPWEQVKYDLPEGLLPFFLANPHQYPGAGQPAQELKPTAEMFDSMIRQAEYQIETLKSHIDFLGKERDKLRETEK